MTVIKWREGFETGVDQFDQEHKKLVELVNAMYIAMRDKANQGEIERIISELISYTGYHFDNEEKAMSAANFPGLEEHRAIHQKLKAEAIAFTERIEKDFTTGTRDLYHFLREWLKEHIMECDKQYSGKI